MSEERIIRKKINEILRKLFEKSEVAPVEPITKPKPKEQPGPKPRRILKPLIHPGADPKPKAENQDIDLKKKINLEEAPMDFVDPHLGGPSHSIKSRLEKREKNPFSKIDILHKDIDGKKTIEKLGDEEYEDVVKQYKVHNRENHGALEMLKHFQEVLLIQQKNKYALEQLAKVTVQKYFGIPNDVIENIIVNLTNNPEDVSMGGNNDNVPIDQEELLDDFTDEEKKIIKQNVDKRIISNALMMGAGFRAHNLMDKIKPNLDRIDKKLYPVYSFMMSKSVMDFWKIEFNDDDTIGLEDDKLKMKAKISMENLQKMGVVGKSELILGEDKNGDGIREVEGAKASAIIFPVLLHETVKAIIEYVFANGLPQYTEKINREIIKQSDIFKDEIWHKLLGPRLWKYLHDAIDFIVKERGNDYTVVAYLLQEISMLPPDKFLRLIDLILHDGNKAVVWLEKMLDRVEYDLANQEGGDEDVPMADFGKVQNLMGQINDLLNQAPEQKPAPVQHKPFSEMSIQELKEFIFQAIDAGDFEKSAEAKDELEKREQQ